MSCKKEQPYQSAMPEPELPTLVDLGFVPLPKIYECPEIVFFKANPVEIFKGESSILSWKIIPVTRSIQAEIEGIGIVPLKGSVEVCPEVSTEYTLHTWIKKDPSKNATETCEVNVKVKMIEVELCSISGLLPNPYCEHKETREYEEGNEPINICKVCEPPKAEVIFVGDPRWTNGGGKKKPWTKVAGNVENIGNLTAINVEVHIKLYWNDRTLAEEQIVSIRDLAPGDNVHWSYKWNMKPEDLWNGKDENLTSFEVIWS